MIKNIPCYDTTLTGGFWKEMWDKNATATVRAVYDRFSETGRFDAFRCDWKEGDPNRPHFFWDSDVAKWMEGAAYILEKKEDPALEKICDEVIDLIEKNQQPDGYFNIYFTVVEPEHRFFNRDWHELYCAGHLTEAACAYYHATGKDKFLNCMRRYIDLIEKVFKDEDSAAFHTPGHEEIELALVKLYHTTGEKRYLELSKHFIDRRGIVNEVPKEFWSNPAYFQSEQPVRNMTEANGHSVRATYLYSGMADIAYEYGDKELQAACGRIFGDITTKKMYITGGIGSSYVGEAFTVPYNLPNDTAYTETCASIGLTYFASRMNRFAADSVYGDTVERAIYNGVISGLSLDGESFFYENPLEILHAERNTNVAVPEQQPRFPITRRQKVFGCSCCPPNLVRFIAGIGEYIASYDEDTIYVNQYMSSTAVLGETRISQKTDYPFSGRIEIAVKNAKGRYVALRIPGFAEGRYSVMSDGGKEEKYENGYVYLKIRTDLCTVILDLDVSPRVTYSAPEVYFNANLCCVCAGPLVYCAESADNGENLRALRIPSVLSYRYETNPVLGTRDIIIQGKRAVRSFDGLYGTSKKYEDTEIRLIPYYAFANREDCDMAVWLPCESI